MPTKLRDVNASKSKAFEIRAKAGSKSAEIIIYDQIGQDMWTGQGVTAKTFSDELKNLDSSVSEINVRINSPGGDVFDGVAIYNRLKQMKAKKIVHVDGLAASIASIIMLAGDEIIIGEGALVMVHLPWTMAVGNRKDIDDVVQSLIDVEEQMISIYQKRSAQAGANLSRLEIKTMLEKETWLDADQAIEMGFADSKVDEAIPIAASAMNKTWMHKAPKNYNSQEKVAREKLANLKTKIGQALSRK